MPQHAPLCRESASLHPPFPEPPSLERRFPSPGVSHWRAGCPLGGRDTTAERDMGTWTYAATGASPASANANGSALPPRESRSGSELVLNQVNSKLRAFDIGDCRPPQPLTPFAYPDFTQESVRDTAGERSREGRRCYSAHDAGLLAQPKTSQLTARGASAYGCGGVSLSAARTSPCRVRR